MPLTAEQLARFRRKIADQGTPPAFPDDELQDLYTEAEEDFDLAVLHAFEELIASTVKFNDYTANQSEEKKSQTFDHLVKVRAIWKAKVDETAAAAKASNQVRIVGLSHVPPRHKDKPGDWSG